ncbi:acyltransferase [Mycolicibacterium moriokaense]|uniref:acyltransferase family protein n=1 Tax=Mycolicibacterium moriokaense TaxID=39691 RepID=UPI0009F34756|nr:acyltransferase [Mycolicibacterium moriokaense]MCV7038370.1 acyltransferase [Mycolicibacterium moriokaense]ORB13685.1 acyltransferase [Mycolicibacterium moriokaense]
MRTGEIKALSGLRIVAAVWVVLFHFRPLLEQASPGFRSALAPVLDCGAQGVDLFFILSGFVLTWNYMDRMGESWSWRATVHFLWLRLSRVWPVYLVTMHLAALWIIFTLNVGHVPSKVADQLTAMNYVKQFLLVQLWFAPYFDGTSWDGPAWSISAEWLAYLLFGALALVIFRIARATRARGLIYLAVAAALPPVLLLMATGLFYTPWSWLPRIVMQFTAGALVCAAVRKLQPSDRARTGAGIAALLIAAAIVGILYWLDAHPMPSIYDSAGLVDVLFVPLVLTLAIGAGTLPALLALRPMVYLGHVSFSLYMVHELVHTTWNWMVEQFEIHLGSDLAGKAVLVGLLAVAFGGAVFLYHFVEEPARKWMRGMMTPPRDTRIEHGRGKLQTIDGQREERTPVVSARAG